METTAAFYELDVDIQWGIFARIRLSWFKNLLNEDEPNCIWGKAGALTEIKFNDKEP